jgi:type II secretion system protein H
VTHPRTPADTGFTLLEVMVTIAIMGTLMALAVGGFQAWSRATEREAFADQLKTTMRQAQLRAVATGRDVCVDIDPAAGTWQVAAVACTSSDLESPANHLEGPYELPAGLRVVDAEFYYDTEGQTREDITFRASGRATPGQMYVAREGDTKMRIKVQELTGRVSIKD